MLTLAADAPADAVVVLSKADLDRGSPRACGGARRAARRPRCCRSPPSTGSSTPSRRCLGSGVTGVLLGASGVGKTSLLNRLAGGERATAPIREADDRGRHTTTWRELVPLAGGGVVIDTPGLKLPRIGEQAAGLAACSPTSRRSRDLPLRGLRPRRRARLRGGRALADGRRPSERVAR